MGGAASPVEVLTTIARSLVAAGEYASVEDALQGMAVEQVRGKIGYYSRRIRRLERKHGMDFEAFSASLRGRATPAEEDDWLEWRSALRMLADWREVSARLGAIGC